MDEIEDIEGDEALDALVRDQQSFHDLDRRLLRNRGMTDDEIDHLEAKEEAERQRRQRAFEERPAYIYSDEEIVRQEAWKSKSEDRLSAILAHKRRRRDFRPSTRGDISAALSVPGGLERIAPQSPRPVEMLETVHVHGDDKLTAGDLALHELLVATAYAENPEMDQERHVIPVRDALAFIGENARLQHLQQSLKRLTKTFVSFDLQGSKGRAWGEVPLLVAWLTAPDGEQEGRELLHYNLPIPVRRMMARPERFAYLELAPLAAMQSKYGIRLYRLLTALTFGMKWKKTYGDDNLLVFEFTPEELAERLGYPVGPEGLHTRKFRERAVAPAIQDLLGVRRFRARELDPIRGTGRGSPVEKIRIEVELCTPDPRIVQNQIMKRLSNRLVKQTLANEVFIRTVVRPDEPRYCVASSTWVRLRQQILPADTTLELVRTNELLGKLVNAFQVALHEALTGTCLTDPEECKSRGFRGAALLAEIDRTGPDVAALEFSKEELSRPSLSAPFGWHSTEVRRAISDALKAADRARIRRYKASLSASGEKTKLAQRREKISTGQEQASGKVDQAPRGEKSHRQVNDEYERWKSPERFAKKEAERAAQAEAEKLRELERESRRRELDHEDEVRGRGFSKRPASMKSRVYADEDDEIPFD
ncbi:Initiator Replication protein [Faunimonas pinastri]|uniref:Initiator Replication protein n=1 Tax=Faunimonas pinastri TaxID=1855383 RepID=A0A1H9QFX8_9HYPH|nr:replication initiation protein [Faunimonas pinastri]SER59461.1 Initiator Replication protein [Faunimonas pinastri]